MSESGVQVLPRMILATLPSRSTTTVRSEWVISKESALSPHHGNSELLAEVKDLLPLTSEEAPNLRIRAEFGRVTLEDFGSIVVGIEGDGEELGVAAEALALKDGGLHRDEVTIHERTVFGERTAGIDESQCEGASGKVAQVSRLCLLVDQGNGGSGLPGSDQADPGRRVGDRTLRIGRSNLFERRKVAFGVSHDQGSNNEIAGNDTHQDANIHDGKWASSWPA